MAATTGTLKAEGVLVFGRRVGGSFFGIKFQPAKSRRNDVIPRI